VFTFSIRPILGVQWMTNENGAEYHRWWGGSMFGYIGKNFGFYANLRDNNESTRWLNRSILPSNIISVRKA
jgi:hypothetical protein